MKVTGTPIELGTENIGKLLKQYAIPAIIAMIASSLYNITDSIFIGHGVGPLAISGLAITFPLMNLAAAFGSLVGAGAATLLSVRLGQKDYTTANSILGNVFIMNLFIGISFTIISLLFLDPILYFFGASEKTLPYAHDFMVIILSGNVITHMYLGLNSMLRSSGKPRQSMYATIFTVLINLVLNPLFIFVFNWGIRGSAIATVISQTSVLIWQIYLFCDKNNFIHIQKGIFKLNKYIVKDSLSIGMSPFLMNAAASVIVIIINQGLLKYGGDLAVGAYGIVNRIAFLFVTIVLGLNQGMQPIAGYNFGAKLYPRVTQVLKKTILGATLVMCTGFLVVESVPHAVASIFTTDKELIDIASLGLRMVFICYPIVGFQIVTSTFFQSIGMAQKAIILSLTRQILFLIPFLLILPKFFGIAGIWLSMPLADFFATILAAIMLYKQYKEFNRYNPEN
ncbi:MULTISPECIES: MATE family efflux transporter [Apibacter]|uniref:MATE family efflux transporter n=1 Tax=Apibacter TaxID=1778601 RepID=UPI0013289C7E|nr:MULTISPECIES: MATE family efflux transporter [Apibacter]MCX8677646.1 MATE family efflux transporter [Apibacter sp. B3919]MXO24158.1 MATE family efflux transporter [Apibacter sp. B3924]MXO26940.1 MATE family efflux transporter [Apibacter sp. B3813]MXO28932.1 MATE family efflux transporter [Apibacter sp. B3913]MXO30883.1 MATE family efflux transporter [Apibacter sp. B3912]